MNSDNTNMNSDNTNMNSDNTNMNSDNTMNTKQSAYKSYRDRLEILGYPKDVQWAKCIINQHGDIVCESINIGKSSVVEIPWFVDRVKKDVIQVALLKSGDITKLKVIHKNNQIKDMAALFRCLDIKELDLSEFDTTSVVDMSKMFSGQRMLQTLDLQNFNFSSVISMRNMFESCISLKEIRFNDQADNKKINTRRLKYMDFTFKYTQIESFYLQIFDLSQILQMKGTFSNCQYLKQIKINNLEQVKLKNMLQTFYKCESLKNIDLSNLSCARVQNMSEMLRQCKSLTDVIMPKDLQNVVTLSETFAFCTQIKTIDLSDRRLINLRQLEKTFIDCKNLRELKIERKYTCKVLNYSGTFKNCENVQQNLLQGIDTQNATETSNMFNGASQISKSPIDFTVLDTQKVEDASLMFYCQRFGEDSNYSIDLSNANIVVGFLSHSEVKRFDFRGKLIGANLKLNQMFTYQGIQKIQFNGCIFEDILYDNLDSFVAGCKNLKEVSFLNVRLPQVYSPNSVCYDLKRRDSNEIIIQLYGPIHTIYKCKGTDIDKQIDVLIDILE